MLTGAVLGTARGAGGEGARGADPVGSGPPPFLNRKRPATATAGKGSGGSGAPPPPPPGPVGSASPAPAFPGGASLSYTHTRDFPSSLSMDLLLVATVLWHRVGPVSRARPSLCSWGGCEARGREIGAFLPPLPGPTGASLSAEGWWFGEHQGWLPTS